MSLFVEGENNSTSLLVVSSDPDSQSVRHIELSIFVCPPDLVQLLDCIFPQRRQDDTTRKRLESGDIRFPIAFTIWHQTNEDMMLLRTNNARQEREQATLKVINLVREMRSTLQQAWGDNVWIDAADPESGMPLFGAQGSSAYNELEDVVPEDFGYSTATHMCCKIAKHTTWGVKAILLTAFANCSLTDEVVTSIKIAFERGCDLK